MKNIRSSYKEYKKNTDKPVDIKTYILISTMYINFILEKVFSGYEITLPFRLGSLKIIGNKQVVKWDENNKIIGGVSPNWKKTKELWDSNPQAKEAKTLVYNTNDHTDGIRYKFLWSKNRVLVSNKTIYSLRMTRNNKRRVYREIMSGKEYITQH